MKKIIATPQMTGACSEATMSGLKFTGEAARQLERLYLTRDVVAQRLSFHRHVLNYFWTVLTAGIAHSHL